MKIEFADKSYIECSKSDNPGKVVLSISAKDHNNPLKRIVNAVEMSIEDFRKLISDVQTQA